MAVQLEDEAMVQLEVALKLLPMMGRWIDVKDGAVARSPRLEGEDRRLVVGEIAQRWSTLEPAERQKYGEDRSAAIAAFTENYVDNVESADRDSNDDEADEWNGIDALMALIWRKHADSIRLRGEGVSQ